MKDIFFTVSIVTMNREAELKQALDSVFKQTYKNFEVIVVDNNSQDNTVKMIKSNFPKVKLIELQKNIGCPPARNISAKIANGDVIFFLDDDAWMEENVLEKTNEAFKNSDDNTVLFSTNLIEYNENDTPILINKIKDKPYEIFIFVGGTVAIKLDKFKEVDYFPEFEYGAEEYYVSLKFFLKKYKMKLIPNIFIHHKPSFSRDFDKMFYNKIKNELIWNYQYSPSFLFPLLFFWKSFNYTKLAFSKGVLKSALYGIRDFLLTTSIIKREPLNFKIFIGFLNTRKKSMKQYKLNNIVFLKKGKNA